LTLRVRRIELAGDAVAVEDDIDGEAVAAAKRSPACVTGDGHKSIRELVADTNLDPRRGWGGEIF
jgi:hypothetical protein